MSQFTLLYPQDITFSVWAIFRVCEMTVLCIRSRISPPRAPDSSLRASFTCVVTALGVRKTQVKGEPQFLCKHSSLFDERLMT